MKSLNIVKKYIGSLYQIYIDDYKDFFKQFYDSFIINDKYDKRIITLIDENTLYIKPLDTYIRYEYHQDGTKLNGVYITHELIDNDLYIYKYPLNRPSEQEILKYLSLFIFETNDFKVIDYAGNVIDSQYYLHAFKSIFTDDTFKLYQSNPKKYKQEDPFYIDETLSNVLNYLYKSIYIGVNIKVTSLDKNESIHINRVDIEHKTIINFYIEFLNTSISISFDDIDSWGDLDDRFIDISYTSPYTYIINTFI